jgi:RNA polymerase sporulation-specific sigma factor
VDKLLSPRERQIIMMRYGLGGIKAQTQREIADSLGISRSYVSRIEKAALVTLRDALK